MAIRTFRPLQTSILCGSVALLSHCAPDPMGEARFTRGSDVERGVAAAAAHPLLNWATTLELAQDDAQFGDRVAAAGDVNGDGYGDVVVGAPKYNNTLSDEGAEFVYFGSSTGLQPTAAWSVESNVTFGNLGESVASAGDVNGDGYDDVVIGGTDRASLYLGSASGLGLTRPGSPTKNSVSTSLCPRPETSTATATTTS